MRELFIKLNYLYWSNQKFCSHNWWSKTLDRIATCIHSWSRNHSVRKVKAFSLVMATNKLILTTICFKTLTIFHTLPTDRQSVVFLSLERHNGSNKWRKVNWKKIKCLKWLQTDLDCSNSVKYFQQFVSMNLKKNFCTLSETLQMKKSKHGPTFKSISTNKLTLKMQGKNF